MAAGGFWEDEMAGDDDTTRAATDAPLITPDDVPGTPEPSVEPRADTLPGATPADKTPADDTTPPKSGKAEPAPATVKPARSRTGAVWVGIVVGTLVLIALIIFMLQNTDEVEVHFLGWTGTAPLAIALLIAGVGVGLIALVVGTLRIAQLKRRLGAARKAATPSA